MRRTLLLLAVASAVGCGSGDTAPAPPPQKGPLFGFNDNAAPAEQLSPEVDAQLAAEAGATTVNVTFDWRFAQRTPDELRVQVYDDVYREMTERGIRPIFQILFAPHWTWDPLIECDQFAEDCKYPPGPAHDGAWLKIVDTLVRRYPKLAAIQVWNEPNLQFFWQSGPDPQRYARLVEIARRAVRDAGSDVAVLGPSLAPLDRGSPKGMETVAFLRRAYAAGMAGQLDGIAVHPYPLDIDDAAFHKALMEARAVRDAHGEKIPIWATELGLSTTAGHDEAAQAAVLARLRRKLTGMPDVRAVLFHTMVDVARHPPGDPERGFGLLRADLTPKPAWCALGGGAAGRDGCPDRVEVGLGRVQEARWEAQDRLEAALDAAQRLRAARGPGAKVTAASLDVPAAAADDKPGPGADPRRIYVGGGTPERPDALVLCNASRGGLAYCALSRDGIRWQYGSSPASIAGAAGAAAHSASPRW